MQFSCVLFLVFGASSAAAIKIPDGNDATYYREKLLKAAKEAAQSSVSEVLKDQTKKDQAVIETPKSEDLSKLKDRLTESMKELSEAKQLRVSNQQRLLQLKEDRLKTVQASLDTADKTAKSSYEPMTGYGDAMQEKMINTIDQNVAKSLEPLAKAESQLNAAILKSQQMVVPHVEAATKLGQELDKATLAEREDSLLELKKAKEQATQVGEAAIQRMKKLEQKKVEYATASKGWSNGVKEMKETLDEVRESAKAEADKSYQPLLAEAAKDTTSEEKLDSVLKVVMGHEAAQSDSLEAVQQSSLKALEAMKWMADESDETLKAIKKKTGKAKEM